MSFSCLLDSPDLSALWLLVSVGLVVAALSWAIPRVPAFSRKFLPMLAAALGLFVRVLCATMTLLRKIAAFPVTEAGLRWALLAGAATFLWILWGFSQNGRYQVHSLESSLTMRVFDTRTAQVRFYFVAKSGGWRIGQTIGGPAD